MLESKKIDHFKDGKFSDEKGNIFRVKKVADFASKNHDKYFIPKFDLKKIENRLEWWEEKYLVDDHKQLLSNLSRVVNCDTSFPLIVLLEDEGSLSVADGLNRLFKALNIEKKKHLPAYFIPKRDIMSFNERDIPNDLQGMTNLAKYLSMYLVMKGIKSANINLDDVDWSFKRMGMHPTREEILNYFDLVKQAMKKRLSESKQLKIFMEKTSAVIMIK